MTNPSRGLDGRKLVRSKTGRKQSGWWSPEKRVEVVTAYLALGKSNLVEAVTGVPPGTVRQWKTQDWWKDLESELSNEQNIELDAKLKKVVNRSLDAVMDRLEHGDFFFNVRTGQIERTPAKLRDVAKVAGDAIDKSVLMQKVVRKLEEAPKLDDHLKGLAEQFARIVKETADAVHARREEGLQSGAPMGEAQPAESGEGSGGEEQGSEGLGPEEGGSEGRGAQEGPLEGGQDDSLELGSADREYEPELQPEQGRVDEVGTEPSGKVT